ncbi:DUF732 domain-containing protein [Paractinoplanes lichenicola]|uniref:DUF732 domain-containing protein n=1 Tax=Paractinoplanes lichenicola TaxID=2802976 RepID=A0ABS1W4R7_9ACTN|nr:DUF732 domain-containing protein [Actinoplanes lichenicola]MBL7261731.1 DUF732 domain-containing protein [Actinoplanes lichenicola]
MRIRPVFSASLTAAALFGVLTGCSDPEPPTPVAPAPPPAIVEESPSPLTSVREREPQASVREREPHASVRETEPQAKAPTRTTARDIDAFVALMREKLPEVVVDRRDEEVAALGEQTCAELKRGRKDTAVIAGMTDQGFTTPDAKTVLTLARTSACPT